MSNRLIIIFLLLSTTSLSLLAQKPRLLRETIDTTLWQDLDGRLTYFYFIDSSEKKIKHGEMAFASDLLSVKKNIDIGYEEIIVKGRYENTLKDNKWELIHNVYYLDNPKVQKGWMYKFSAQLQGDKKIYTLNFNSGKRDGTWKIKHLPLVNGRVQKEEPLAVVNYSNDTLSGHFNFQVGSIEDALIEGKVNSKGFLDSVLTIVYIDQDREVKEVRNYNDGFLIDLKKLDPVTDSIEIHVQYIDVQYGLVDMNIKDKDFLIKKDSNLYEVLFDNNYDEDDKRLTEQKAGNKILNKAFQKFSLIDSLFDEQLSSQLGPGTSRFVYTYPEDEEGAIDKLLDENKAIEDLVSDLLNRPKFMLRKTQSKELTYISALVETLKSLIQAINKELTYINSGAFKFQNRANYYESGISSLKDTLFVDFKFQGNEYRDTFSIGRTVDSHSHLLENIKEYQNVIRDKINQFDSQIEQSLTFYDEQDKIDSLEKVMSDLYNSLDSLYTQFYTIQDENSENLGFELKAYKSVKERLLDPLADKYLKESLEFEEALATSKNIICLLSFLDDNHERLSEISDMPKVWNDSIFTVYQDNPFDYRKFESKIMPGIQSASNILLKDLANNLLNAKSCEALNNELKQIQKLENRLLYLRERQGDSNVKVLDRSLRRERVPQRISRLLEL